MALIITDNQHYSNIASAIRTKLGTNETFAPAEMASAIMSISGGGSGSDTLVVTLSYNETTEMWEPNKTITEIDEAYVAGKVITVDTDQPPSDVVADGEVVTERGRVISLIYWVRQYFSDNGYDNIREYYYILNIDNGLLCDSIYEYTTPEGTETYTDNGTYNVYHTSSVTINVHAEHEDYIQKYTSANALTTFTDLSSTAIVYGAFAYTSSLATVSFPEATTIGNYAFAYCYKLHNINFPKVKTINTYAFQYCSSLTMSIDSSTFPALSGTINGYAFRGCQYLTGINHSGITSLGAQTFSACSRIKTVNLPNVTSIGAGAFSYLTTCSEYSLPKLTYVASNAFTSNWSLTTLTLPAATTISAYAFRYCSKLMSLYLTGSTVPTLNASAFLNMPFSVSVNDTYGSIYVPSSLYATYSTATNWATYKNRLVSF